MKGHVAGQDTVKCDVAGQDPVIVQMCAISHTSTPYGVVLYAWMIFPDAIL